MLKIQGIIRGYITIYLEYSRLFDNIPQIFQLCDSLV